jgi:hypothetical protein
MILKVLAEDPENEEIMVQGEYFMSKAARIWIHRQLFDRISRDESKWLITDEETKP